MANLLADTDFVGELFIDFTNQNLKSDFNTNYLPSIEKKYLEYLLGHSLYSAFIAGLNVTSPETPEQKWIDLLDGADFTVEINSKNVTLYFEGVKELLKLFVWSAYQKDLQIKYTSSGAKINSSDNTVNSLDFQKAFDIYNKAVTKYGNNVIGFSEGADDIEFNENYQSLNRGLLIFRRYEQEIRIPSAYNFIFHKEKEMAGTYQNWVFTPLTYALNL